MRVNYALYYLLAVFFVIVDITYIVWNLAVDGSVEWAGTVALTLAACLGGFLAFYLHRVHGEQGGELPEDRIEAHIDDREGELGHFSPWSWWPILLAGGAALLFLGLAIGFWISFIGAGLTVIFVVGWVYEYYRRYFAR